MLAVVISNISFLCGLHASLPGQVSGFTMAVARRALFALKRPTGFAVVIKPLPVGRRRCFASVCHAANQGPLTGLRVLDLTRVLAGVGRPLCLSICLEADISFGSHSAHRSSETWGMLDGTRPFCTTHSSLYANWNKVYSLRLRW